jgi:hypothetical protein
MSSDKIPGVPEGWVIERIGKPIFNVDHVIHYDGQPMLCDYDSSYLNRVIIRKIEKPAKYRPFKDAEEFKPHRDRWICRLYNGRPDAKGCYKVNAYDDRGTFANDGKTSYQDMLEEGRVFDDGTPFGVRIDE